MKDPDSLTAAQLVATVCREVFGADWQTPLSRALDLNLRTVQRMAAAAEAGDDYRPAALWLDELVPLLDGHLVRLARLRAVLVERSAA